MNIKKYGEEVIEHINIMTDEEFNKLLKEAGLENCPTEEEWIKENINKFTDAQVKEFMNDYNIAEQEAREGLAQYYYFHHINELTMK